MKKMGRDNQVHAQMIHDGPRDDSPRDDRMKAATETAAAAGSWVRTTDKASYELVMKRMG